MVIYEVDKSIFEKTKPCKALTSYYKKFGFSNLSRSKNVEKSIYKDKQNQK